MVTLSTSAEPGTNAVESGEALALHLGRAGGGTGRCMPSIWPRDRCGRCPAALLGLVRAESRATSAPAGLHAECDRGAHGGVQRRGPPADLRTRTGTNGELGGPTGAANQRGEPEARPDLAGRLRAAEVGGP